MKKKVQSIIIKISTCTKTELREYATKLYMSKQDFDKKAWSFIERAIDIQERNLNEHIISPLAIGGELKEGEIWNLKREDFLTKLFLQYQQPFKTILLFNILLRNLVI